MPQFSFLSLIPELKVESGHHYPYHRKLKEAIEHLDGSFTAYVNQKCTIHSLGKEWKKWFRRKKEPKFVLRYIFRLFVDYSKIFLHEEKKYSKRIFFLESFASGDLIAFVFASLFFAKKKDDVWILFRFERGKKEMALQSFLMKIAKKILKEKWNLFCDSDLLGQHLEKQFHQKLHLLMHYLSPFESLSKNDNLEQKERLACAWMGGPRLEKGLFAIKKLMTLQDPIAERFTLIYPEKAPLPSSHEQLLIHQTKENLEWGEYLKVFERCDVILLPYDSISYLRRSSGIFIETIIGGKIPLVRKDTWLAFRLKEFNLDELIVDWENPRFFTHLYELIQNPEVSVKIKKMQQSYKEYHSFSSFTQTIKQYVTPSHAKL